MKMFICILLLTFPFFASQAKAQDKWQIADEQTVRLSPKTFSQLPKAIVLYLQKRGCTIPQSSISHKPHNVIRGQFYKRGQFDWAVLCSVNNVSSILVFWNGSIKNVSNIERSADKNYLQLIDGDIAFSRALTVADKDYISRHHRKSKLSEIKHQGINDGFVGKASTVHYFYKKRWLKQQGAD